MSLLLWLLFNHGSCKMLLILFITVNFVIQFAIFYLFSSRILADPLFKSDVLWSSGPTSTGCTTKIIVILLVAVKVLCGWGLSCTSLDATLTFAFLGRDRLALGGRFQTPWRLSLLLLLCHSCNGQCLLACLNWSVYCLCLWRCLVCCRSIIGIGMLIRSARLLLISWIQSKSEAFATFLVVGCGLRDSFSEILVWDIVVLLISSWCGGTRLDYHWVHILNLRDFNLLFTVFTWRTTTSHLLRRIWTITSTTTTHQGRVMPELKAFVSLTRADWGVMVRTNFTTSEPFLKLWRTIECWSATLNLLLGLSYIIHRLRLMGSRVGRNWVSDLGSCWLLRTCYSTAFLLDLKVMATFMRGRWSFVYAFRYTVHNLVLNRLLLSLVFLTRIIAEALGHIKLALASSVASLLNFGFWWGSNGSIHLLFSSIVVCVLGGLVGRDLGLTLNFLISYFTWIILFI